MAWGGDCGSWMAAWRMRSVASGGSGGMLGTVRGGVPVVAGGMVVRFCGDMAGVVVVATPGSLMTGLAVT
jgi:hypothetical protein